MSDSSTVVSVALVGMDDNIRSVEITTETPLKTILVDLEVCRSVTGAIEDLIACVDAINMARGLEWWLDLKLDFAVRVLDDHRARNDVAAIYALECFVNTVENQRNTCRISHEDADLLIEKAQDVLDLLVATLCT